MRRRSLALMGVGLLTLAGCAGHDPAPGRCLPEICVGDSLNTSTVTWQTAPQRRFDEGAPVEATIAQTAVKLFPGLSEDGGKIVGRYRFNIDDVTYRYFSQVKTVCHYTVVTGRYASPGGSITTVTFGPTPATPQGGGLRVVALERRYPFASTSSEGKAALAGLPSGTHSDADPATGNLVVTLADPQSFYFVDEDSPGRSRLDAELRAQPACHR